MSEKFGEKIRMVRTKRKQTLEELAEALGTSKAYVWQIENKKKSKPSAELLLKIANYFGESPEYLLDDKRDEPSESQMEDAIYRKIQNLSPENKKVIEKIISSLEKDD